MFLVVQLRMGVDIFREVEQGLSLIINRRVRASGDLFFVSGKLASHDMCSPIGDLQEGFAPGCMVQEYVILLLYASTLHPGILTMQGY